MLSLLHNPVYAVKDNVRDPSVFKTGDGYHLFYSRFSGHWNDSDAWHVTAVFTRDFSRFETERDISPSGFASPDAPIFWHGRFVLAFQSYPDNPSRLCFSESNDLEKWSAPKFMLPQALALKWNLLGRTIDPTLVVDGDTLHCYFVGSGRQTTAKGETFKSNMIGHAVTRDPSLEKWEVLSVDAPLIGVSERAPDGVENVTVYKSQNEWLMIFSEGLEHQHLALATSRDLYKWEIEGPIEVPLQDWNTTKYGAPFVWREAARWNMILMGETKGRTTFGLLTSDDGRDWTMLPEWRRE